MHDFGKPWWGVAYVPCMTNLRALCAWVIRWHVTCILSLAEHRQGRRALSNHVCAHSVISMWHVVCLQHLARACSEQSRSTTVLPINHVIQMPQCLSGFVNHNYCCETGLLIKDSTKSSDIFFFWFMKLILHVKQSMRNIMFIDEGGMIPLSVLYHRNTLSCFICLNDMSQGLVL